MSNTTNGNAQRLSLWKLITCGSGTAQDRRNQYIFTAWALAWAVTYVACNWALTSDYDISQPLAWIIAIVPSVFGIAAVLSYMKFLRMADELIRKMQLDGLAFGFGVSLVFALGYQVLEQAGAPQLETNNLVLVMIGGWMLGQIIAFWRYQ